MQKFVPENIGFQHISRQEVLDKHTTDLSKKLLTVVPTQLPLVSDCNYCRFSAQVLNIVFHFFFIATYLYIQKPSDNEFQRQTFSAHKSRSLVKPMFITATDGYIIDVVGPFLCDSKNNDSSILKHYFWNNLNEILGWIEEDDILVTDRGFRGSENATGAFGIHQATPNFLKGRTQVGKPNCLS